MGSFNLTNKAVEDLTNIWNYTFEEWSENQADTYYFLLLEMCQDLADNPTIGKSYKDIGIEIFGFKAHRHIIFYEIKSKNEIEIVRILHGRMDIENILK
ncbi:type II toxin-antitoxin system RelE/ParE family toxin [Flavobacterium sp. U410]